MCVSLIGSLISNGSLVLSIVQLEARKTEYTLYRYQNVTNFSLLDKGMQCLI